MKKRFVTAQLTKFTLTSAANPIWRTLGKACEPQDWQVETGQILVSKLARGGMNLAALFAAEAMNANHEFWFRLSGGDKDTFVSLYLEVQI